MNAHREIMAGIRELDPSRKDLRNLGLVFLAALACIGGFLLWRGRPAWPYFLGAAGLLGLWGLLWPAGLRPLYKVWMSLALVMGFVVSRILLAVLFYGVVTPIGWFMRLTGKDLLDRKMGDRDSYWHLREDHDYDPQQSEKMY